MIPLSNFPPLPFYLSPSLSPPLSLSLSTSLALPLSLYLSRSLSLSLSLSIYIYIYIYIYMYVCVYRSVCLSSSHLSFCFWLSLPRFDHMSFVFLFLLFLFSFILKISTHRKNHDPCFAVTLYRSSLSSPLFLSSFLFFISFSFYFLFFSSSNDACDFAAMFPA